MILVTERDHLAQALSRVAAIVDSKQTIAILGNVLLTAAGDRLGIRSTNLDMEAVEYIPASIGAEGSTTVSAAKLLALANSLPQGAQVGMKLDDLRLLVTSGRTRVNLACIHPNSFPALWSDEWAASVDLPGEELARMLDRVSYAMCAGGGRAYLMGTNISVVADRLRVVAIEGAHMAYCDGPEVDPMESATIPAKMIGEMQRLLSGVRGPVTLALSSSKVSLRFEDITITSKLIDGSLGFPDYNRLFPKDLTKVATANVSTLIAAIRRALIASQNSKDNTVRVVFKPGAVSVTARNAEADAFDEIDAEYDGEETWFALHPVYLTGILDHLGGDTAEFTFRDNDVAMTIRAVGDGGSNSLILGQRVGA